MKNDVESAVDDLAVRRHLLRMRITTGAFLATVPAAMITAFLAPRRLAMASPLAMTILAVAASLWIGFSAGRDARARLDRTKRAFAVHGDERRLLREHWMVYLVVLLRLEVMVICGLVVALWGLGPGTAMWLLLLAGVMIALTWPSSDKTRLLLERARSMRTF